MASNFLNEEHPDYKAQVEDWIDMDDLYAGAKAVKAAGTRYLPATEIEEKTLRSAGVNKKSQYERRLENAVFFNGVARLTRYAMGHIFRIPPVFDTTKFGSYFKRMHKDSDLMGTPLPSFMEQVGAKSYHLGVMFVLVDMPNMTGVDSRSVQKMVDPRPYLVQVHPREIINWKIRRSLDGSYQFDWVVQRYSLHESNGPTDLHAEAVYYKIWYKDKWELWKCLVTADSADLSEIEPILEDQGPNPLGMVPLVPIPSDNVRPMVFRQPLREAASLNIDHYRMMSSFRHGLALHLNPKFVTIGTSDNKIDMSAESGLSLPRNGDAKYVETAGNGLKIAMETAHLIASEMWEAGMRSSDAVGANTSAEARKLSRSDFFSFLKSVTSLHEHGWNQVFHIANLWVKARIEMTTEDEKSPVKLNDDFDVAQLEANQAEFLLNARKAGELSKEEFLGELTRGGVLRDDLNIPEEMAKSKKDLEEDMAILAAAEAAANAGKEPAEGGSSKPAA